MNNKTIIRQFVKVFINSKEYFALGINCLSIKKVPIANIKIILDKSAKVNLKDNVTVKLCDTSDTPNEWTIFTGWVENFYIDNYLIVFCKNANTFALSKQIAENYTNERAKNIITDLLNIINITSYKVTLPDITLDFVAHGTFCKILNEFIEALYLYGVENEIHYFFDHNNIFRLGTINDVAIHDYSKIFNLDNTFIFHNLENGIQIIPLPIKHSQKVIYNNQEIWTTRTNLVVYPKYSYMEVYW